MLPKFINILLQFSRVLGSASVVGISVVVFIGVLARYVFLYPIPWVEELSKFLLMWAVYLGVAAVSFRGEHLRADVIGSILSPRALKIRDTLYEAIQAVLMAILVLETYIFAFKIRPFGQVSAVLGVPQWVMMLIFAIGLTFVVPMHIYRILGKVTGGTEEIEKEVGGES